MADLIYYHINIFLYLTHNNEMFYWLHLHMCAHCTLHTSPNPPHHTVFVSDIKFTIYASSERFESTFTLWDHVWYCTFVHSYHTIIQNLYTYVFFFYSLLVSESLKSLFKATLHISTNWKTEEKKTHCTATWSCHAECTLHT